MIPGKLINGEMWMLASDHHIAVAALRAEAAETEGIIEGIFNLRRDADARAIRRWQESHGTEAGDDFLFA